MKLLDLSLKDNYGQFEARNSSKRFQIFLTKEKGGKKKRYFLKKGNLFQAFRQLVVVNSLFHEYAEAMVIRFHGE